MCLFKYEFIPKGIWLMDSQMPFLSKCAGKEAGSIVWSYADHGGIICIMNQDMRSVRISRK